MATRSGKGGGGRLVAYQEIEKTCKCDLQTWQDIQIAAGRRLEKEQARDINESLGPITQEGDVLKKDPAIIGNHVTFSVVTKTKLKLEAGCLTVAKGSPAEWSYLGPSGMIGTAIPPDTRDHRCADVGAKFNMWIAKALLPLGLVGGGQVTLSPGPGHMLRAGEQVWFRFSRRRLVTPILVVSQETHDTNVLRTPHLVFKELSKTEQFLMLPAISRTAGSVFEPDVQLRSFVECGNITASMVQKIGSFFMDGIKPETKSVRLKAIDIFKRPFAMLDRPAAIAGNDQLWKIKDGQYPTVGDCHGVKEHLELMHFLNMRSKLGNVAGIVHAKEPQVAVGLPEPYGNKWFQSPLGSLSVVAPGDELLFLADAHLASDVDHVLKLMASQKPEDCLVELQRPRPTPAHPQHRLWL